MKKIVVNLILCLTVMVLISACQKNPAQVLVVGSIHQKHRINKEYTYSDFLDIIHSFKPDVICVEILEEDFRKNLYLKEMMLATIYGIDKGIKVYPIDWSSGSTRDERAKYMKTPDYVVKKAEFDNLDKNNLIIQAFESKYGDWNQYAKKQGYEFYNGEEYNEYIRVSYDISMDVFGDHSMNLYYETRNNEMLERICDAIHENPGKKIIVLTGAEHKHYFDNKLLDMSEEVRLIDFGSILPLSSFELEDELDIYYAKGLATDYLNKDLVEDLNHWYKNALVPLVHGPDMDFNPDIIPMINIKSAGAIIDEWMKDEPLSPILRFELGWYYFLTGSIQEAIDHYNKIIPQMEDIPERYRKHVWGSLYRNLGMCYDLLGLRQEAIASYKKGKELFKSTGRPESVMRALYKDYIENPYIRTRKESKTSKTLSP